MSAACPQQVKNKELSEKFRPEAQDANQFSELITANKYPTEAAVIRLMAKFSEH